MKISREVANEIARLMRDPNALRHERGRMPPYGRHGYYNPNQPRVPAGQSGGGRWTDADAAASGLNDSEHPQLVDFSPGRPPVQTPVRPPIQPPIRPPGAPGLLGALLTLFAIWSARNTPERRAVFEFNAREYLKGSNDELVEADVDTLNREEVKKACPGIDEVQDKTNKAYSDVMLEGGWFMSPQQRGTAIHKQLERSIKGDAKSKLQAEVSRVKSDDENITTASGTQFGLMCWNVLTQEPHACTISKPAKAGVAVLVQGECESSPRMRSRPAPELNVSL